MIGNLKSFYKKLKDYIGITILGGTLFVGYHTLKYNPDKEFNMLGLCMMTYDGSKNEEISEKLGKNFLTFSNFEGVREKNYFPADNMIKISSNLVKDLVEASYEIHSMCLEAVDVIVKDDVLLDLFEIPNDLKELCKDSWEKKETDCLGRFDFIYDGKGKPKLLEYNADTPTLLIESGIGQRILFNERIKEKECQQFNFIEEGLSTYWKNYFIKNKEQIKSIAVIGDRDSEEDKQTTDYMLNFIKEAAPSQNAQVIDVEALKYDKLKNVAYSLPDNNFDMIWKLYPYEWLEREEFGEYFEDMSRTLKLNKSINLKTRFIEPPWKLILSSKALLPFLWEMYPNHPNLLPAYFEEPINLNSTEYPQISKDLEKNKQWVQKSKFGREGNNIKSIDYTHIDFSKSNKEIEHSNDPHLHDHEKIHFGDHIYQAYEASVVSANYFFTFGSWIINGLPLGIGIRISDTWITNHDSSFVSHFFIPDKTIQFSVSEQQAALRKVLYGDNENNFANVYGSFRKFIKLPSEKTLSSQTKHHSSSSRSNYGFYRSAKDNYMAKTQKDTINSKNINENINTSTHSTASEENKKQHDSTERKRVQTGKTSRNYSLRS